MEKNQKMNKQMQIEIAEKYIREHTDIDPSTVDLQAEIDSSLHFDENWNSIKDELGIKTQEELEEEIKNYEEKIRERRSKQLREEYEEELEEVREEGENVKEYYSVMREYIKSLIRMEAETSLILYSRAGLGKSYQVLSTLKELGLKKERDYEVINTFSSPLSLYHDLYNNKDKILVLDDVEGITGNKKALSMLKAVTWNPSGKRIVQYHSTTSKLEAPKQFEFKGSIIICMNRKSDLPDMKALISRSIYYELELTYKELTEGLFPKIAEKEMENTKDRKELLNYIQNNTDPSSDLDLRTLMKSINMYNYAKQNNVDWKPLVNNLLGGDEEYQLIWNLMKSNKKVTEQATEFKKKTGKSKRTYYRKKKEIEKKLEED